jgi:hypothetical protein
MQMVTLPAIDDAGVAATDSAVSRFAIAIAVVAKFAGLTGAIDAILTLYAERVSLTAKFPSYVCFCRVIHVVYFSQVCRM